MKMCELLCEAYWMPPIRVVPDDSNELMPSSAAEFKRRTGEIVIRDQYKNNTHIRNHEIGHALLDGIQPSQWQEAFETAPKAWIEFLATSVAKSYQKRQDMTRDDLVHPRSYDWIEVGPDLYMSREAGRLDALPHLNRVLQRLINLASSTHAIAEADTLELPNIDVGDEVLVGKWKNRKATVKGFTTDPHNQPVLKTDKGDQKLFKPRLAKLIK